MTTRIALGKFCVYKHFINDRLIYVGQGAGYRPFTSEGRNEKWYKLTNKAGCFDVEVVACFNRQEDAIAFEKKLILEHCPPANIIHNSKVYHYTSKRNHTVDFNENIYDRKKKRMYKNIKRASFDTGIARGVILRELTKADRETARFVYRQDADTTTC